MPMCNHGCVRACEVAYEGRYECELEFDFDYVREINP